MSDCVINIKNGKSICLLDQSNSENTKVILKNVNGNLMVNNVNITDHTHEDNPTPPTPSEHWITQNGECFYIDRYNRMYRLLLRQDITKDVDGNPQSNAGWPNTDSMITNTNKLNHLEPKTAAQYLDFNVNWDDYRDENGKLEFKKEWPGIEERYPYDSNRLVNFINESGTEVTDWMTWRQVEAPPANGNAEDIDEGNNIDFYNRQGGGTTFDFDGLLFDTQNHSYSDGSNPGWFYAAGVLGSIPNFVPGRFIPIMFLGGLNNDANNWIVNDKVNLWLRVPTKVYLTAGQSNSVGYGEQNELLSGLTAGVPLNNVKYWGRSNSSQATSTQFDNITPGSTHASRYFGYELPLAYYISQDNNSSNAPLYDTKYVIKYAHGGTNLHSQWNHEISGQQWTRWRDIVEEALMEINRPYQVVGLCWMQGESDANNNSNSLAYEANLVKLIEEMRSVVGFPKMYFIIGKIFAPGLNQTYVNHVRTGQQNVADNDEYVFTIETNDFTGGTAANVGLRDGIHYNGNSLNIMAERFWNILNNHPDLNIPTPINPNIDSHIDNFNIKWHKLLSQDLRKNISTDVAIDNSTNLTNANAHFWNSAIIQQQYLNPENASYGNYHNFNVNYIRNSYNNIVFKIQWGDDERNWEYIEQSSIPTADRDGNNLPTTGFVPIRVNSYDTRRNQGIARSLNGNDTWMDTDAVNSTWWGSIGYIRQSLFSNIGMPAVNEHYPSSIYNNLADVDGNKLYPTKVSLWMATEGIGLSTDRSKISILEYDISGNWWRKMLHQNINKDYNNDSTINTPQYWHPSMCSKHIWNEDEPWKSNYINFNIDYNSHINNDKYTYRINYPGLLVSGVSTNIIFSQKNKPLESIDSFTLDHSNALVPNFDGIAPETRYNTWLSGNLSHLSNWWYSLGTFYPHSSGGQTGIPAIPNNQIANEVTFWIKTPIASSNDIFNIDVLNTNWHSLLNYNSPPPPGIAFSGLQLIYNNQKRVYFDSTLVTDTTPATHITLYRPGGVTEGVFSFSLFENNTHKNNDLRLDMKGKIINFITIIELVKQPNSNLNISNFIEKSSNSGTVSLDNFTITNTFKHNKIYELKTTAIIPESLGSDEYKFGIKVTGGNTGSNNIYIHIRVFRIEYI